MSAAAVPLATAAVLAAAAATVAAATAAAAVVVEVDSVVELGGSGHACPWGGRFAW